MQNVISLYFHISSCHFDDESLLFEFWQLFKLFFFFLKNTLLHLCSYPINFVRSKGNHVWNTLTQKDNQENKLNNFSWILYLIFRLFLADP